MRDRREDILVLADHFLQQFSRAAGRKPLKFSADARKRLEHHDWPGNIRELRNLLERVAYLCQADKVETTDLAFILRPTKDDTERFSGLDLAGATDAFQKEHIKQAIEKAGGHMGDAAKLLGLHRPNLYRKMRHAGDGDEVVVASWIAWRQEMLQETPKSPTTVVVPPSLLKLLPTLLIGGLGMVGGLFFIIGLRTIWLVLGAAVGVLMVLTFVAAAITQRPRSYHRT